MSDDDIWRGVDRQIDRLDEAVETRLSRRPRALPVANGRRTTSAFPTGVALSVALVLLVVGGMVAHRPTPQITPGTPMPTSLGSTVPSSTPTTSASPSLEVITGNVGGNALIHQRMGWTCGWIQDSLIGLPDLSAIDRAAAEQGVHEGWVTLDRVRQRLRVWVGDRVEPAAIAHDAQLLAKGRGGDYWILVAPAETPMAVELVPRQTPGGRTAWFEVDRTGPCPGSDPADELPLDPAIKPVSIASASEEEQRVMDLCPLWRSSVENVAGMGKIPRARDAYKYAPLTGREPDLKNDSPAWIIVFDGMIELPRGGGLARDPICVMTAIEPGPLLLLPWGTVQEPRSPENTRQEYRLPPLLP